MDSNFMSHIWNHVISVWFFFCLHKYFSFSASWLIGHAREEEVLMEIIILGGYWAFGHIHPQVVINMSISDWYWIYHYGGYWAFVHYNIGHNALQWMNNQTLSWTWFLSISTGIYPPCEANIPLATITTTKTWFCCEKSTNHPHLLVIKPPSGV